MASIVEDRDACRALQKTLNKSHEETTFGTQRQQGQRVVCVDVDGQGYHIPYIPAEAKFDGTLNELKPFALTDTIEFIDALSFNLVMVVRRADTSQWVCLYNLDSDEVVFEMAAPQPQTPNPQMEDEEQEASASESALQKMLRALLLH